LLNRTVTFNSVDDSKTQYPTNQTNETVAFKIQGKPSDTGSYHQSTFPIYINYMHNRT